MCEKEEEESTSYHKSSRYIANMTEKRIQATKSHTCQ